MMRDTREDKMLDYSVVRLVTKDAWTASRNSSLRSKKKNMTHQESSTGDETDAEHENDEDLPVQCWVLSAGFGVELVLTDLVLNATLRHPLVHKTAQGSISLHRLRRDEKEVPPLCLVVVPSATGTATANRGTLLHSKSRQLAHSIGYHLPRLYGWFRQQQQQQQPRGKGEEDVAEEREAGAYDMKQFPTAGIEEGALVQSRLQLYGQGGVIVIPARTLCADLLHRRLSISLLACVVFALGEAVTPVEMESMGFVAELIATKTSAMTRTSGTRYKVPAAVVCDGPTVVAEMGSRLLRPLNVVDLKIFPRFQLTLHQYISGLPSLSIGEELTEYSEGQFHVLETLRKILCQLVSEVRAIGEADTDEGEVPVALEQTTRGHVPSGGSGSERRGRRPSWVPKRGGTGGGVASAPRAGAGAQSGGGTSSLKRLRELHGSTSGDGSGGVVDAAQLSTWYFTTALDLVKTLTVQNVLSRKQHGAIMSVLHSAVPELERLRTLLRSLISVSELYYLAVYLPASQFFSYLERELQPRDPSRQVGVGGTRAEENRPHWTLSNHLGELISAATQRVWTQHSTDPVHQPTASGRRPMMIRPNLEGLRHERTHSVVMCALRWVHDRFLEHQQLEPKPPADVPLGAANEQNDPERSPSCCCGTILLVQTDRCLRRITRRLLVSDLLLSAHWFNNTLRYYQRTDERGDWNADEAEREQLMQIGRTKAKGGLQAKTEPSVAVGQRKKEEPTASKKLARGHNQKQHKDEERDIGAEVADNDEEQEALEDSATTADLKSQQRSQRSSSSSISVAMALSASDPYTSVLLLEDNEPPLTQQLTMSTSTSAGSARKSADAQSPGTEAPVAGAVSQVKRELYVANSVHQALLSFPPLPEAEDDQAVLTALGLSQQQEQHHPTLSSSAGSGQLLVAGADPLPPAGSGNKQLTGGTRRVSQAAEEEEGEMILFDDDDEDDEIQCLGMRPAPSTAGGGGLDASTDLDRTPSSDVVFLGAVSEEEKIRRCFDIELVSLTHFALLRIKEKQNNSSTAEDLQQRTETGTNGRPLFVAEVVVMLDCEATLATLLPLIRSNGYSSMISGGEQNQQKEQQPKPPRSCACCSKAFKQHVLFDEYDVRTLRKLELVQALLYQERHVILNAMQFTVFKDRTVASHGLKTTSFGIEERTLSTEERQKLALEGADMLRLLSTEAQESEKPAIEEIANEKGKLVAELQVDYARRLQVARELEIGPATRMRGGRGAMYAASTSGGAVAVDVRPVVLFDEREFRAILPYQVYRQGMEVIPLTLLSGDYVLGPNTAIERKALRDLFQSVQSGRLANQLTAMERRFGKCILLVEFDRSRPFCFSSQAVGSSPDFGFVSTERALEIRTKLIRMLLNCRHTAVFWTRTPHHSAALIRSLKETIAVENPDAADASLTSTEVRDRDEYHRIALDVLLRFPGVTRQNVVALIHAIQNATPIPHQHQHFSPPPTLVGLSKLSQQQMEAAIGVKDGTLLHSFLHTKLPG